MMKKDLGTFKKFITALKAKNQHKVADLLQSTLGIMFDKNVYIYLRKFTNHASFFTSAKLNPKHHLKKTKPKIKLKKHVANINGVHQLCLYNNFQYFHFCIIKILLWLD